MVSTAAEAPSGTAVSPLGRSLGSQVGTGTMLTTQGPPERAAYLQRSAVRAVLSWASSTSHVPVGALGLS